MMTVLLWNTGERLCSGPWRIPPFFFYTPPPCNLLPRSAPSAGLRVPRLARSFSFLFQTFTANLKINHPGTKIPESRRRRHTCVNFLHHEAQDFAFWKAACFGLSPAFGLPELLASDREAELFRLKGSDAFSHCQQMDK